MKKEDFRFLYLTLITGAFLLITGCVPSLLETSERAAPHFRQVRWGQTKDWIRMNERDKRPHSDALNALIYNIRHSGIPMQLVYGFGEDKGVYRLRSAGYLTPSGASVDDPDKVFRQGLLEKLGEPIKTLRNGGMLWVGHETVVYTNTYRLGGGNRVSLDGTPFDSKLPIPKHGHTAAAHYLIVGYMERGFYDELLETLNKETLEEKEFSAYKKRAGYKLSNDNRLSAYEEKLFSGMLREILRQNSTDRIQ